MPQVPLFVSSAGEATQNGSTTIRFQQPLEIPAGAKDATVHVSTATIPYTMPNVTAETNTLVVVLPKQVDAHSANTDYVRDAQGLPMNFVIRVHPGLYDVAGLEKAINAEVNKLASTDMRVHSRGFFKRAASSEYVSVQADGTNGAAIAEPDVPNWCSLLPDYGQNRLDIRLNHAHSGILFSDSRTTLGKVLGFSHNVGGYEERYDGLFGSLSGTDTTSVKLDIIHRASTSSAWQTFGITIPKRPVAGASPGSDDAKNGYTITELVAKINALVMVHSSGVRSSSAILPRSGPTWMPSRRPASATAESVRCVLWSSLVTAGWRSSWRFDR